MYTWRGGLCHDELHQAKATHYYHTAQWGSCKPDQTLSTPGLSTGNFKAFSAPHRDAAKAAAVPTVQHSSDISTVDQGSYRQAGRLVHKATCNSHAYDPHFGMSPDVGCLAVLHADETCCMGTVPLSPAREATQHSDNTIDASLLSQLLAQSANSSSCSSSAGVPDKKAPSVEWSLSTALQQGASSATAACCPVNMQAVNDLLTHFPPSQHKTLLDSLLASSNPQELLLAMQAAAAAATAAAQQPLDSPVNAHLLQQQAMAAGSTAANSSHQLLQQLQLQASMAAQQAALCSSLPANAQDILLQQCAGGAGSGSPTKEGLLQLLLQQQAAAVPGAEQQMQAILLASVAGGSASTAVSQTMPGLANTQQQLLYGTNTALPSMWPAAAVDASAGLGSPAVAAVLAQQQQQARLASLMAEAATVATQQQQSAMLVAAAQGGQFNQLAAKLMASQLAASCPSTFGFLGSSPSSNLIARFGGSSTRPGIPRAAGVQDMVPAAHQQSFFDIAGCSNHAAGKGRRSRAGHHSSRANSTGLGTDIFGAFGSTASSTSSRAASVAGSDFSSSVDNSVAAAGVSVADLSPSKFEDYWGATDVGSSCGSAGSRAASDAVSSWPSSSSGAGSLATSPVSSRAGSATAESWQSHEEDSAAAPALGSLSLNGSCGATGLTKPCDSVSAPKSDQTAMQAPAGASATATTATTDEVGGCTVWFPGAREAAGDDTWYLDLPNTCRLFVGNIGSWVDEDMLTAYFGKYGNVVDVQVMWNTKMLARGRRVNREFAFISYSSPLEAARAVHWLDGCRLVDLEKDRNGITVEYENGEGDSKK